jgi:hypothetical protein
MNSKDLFNKAVIKTNLLPELIDTPAMRRQVMMATVAEWLWQLDDILDRPSAHESVLTTASETMTMINRHLFNQEQ